MPKQKKPKSGDFLKFLGTAGARFVMIKQLRASGGIWIKKGNTNVIIDPGPGSIVRCASSKPKLDPCQLDAIILTHRHLDHSNDINVMIEAMTEGGYKKRGSLFAPKDALEEDSLILKHVRSFVGSIEPLKEKTSYSVGSFEFMTGPHNAHPVETYGFKFNLNNKSISLVGDTAFYPEILDFFKSDIIILNTVFYEPRPSVQHLCLNDAKHIIFDLKPETAILTHFGMTMLKAKPHNLVESFNQEVQTNVIAAYDGMTLIPS